MFLSDKNVQDCLRYKHGLITAAQLADLLNYPDVDYVQHWANTSTFTTRQYETFAATQKAERMTNTVMSADSQGLSMGDIAALRRQTSMREREEEEVRRKSHAS